MPNTKRPPEKWSTLAMAFAHAMGSCCGTRQIPVPTTRRSVTTAAAVQVTNGSWVCAYILGSSLPPDHGERRLVGMWVCSGKNSEWKPRSSIARASSRMSMP